MTGSPYKGLAAFDDSERDVALFFGRDGETGVICANLMASRLTVLYGETGVGKSSVLRAGVAHEMRRTAGAHAVVVFDNWKDDPAAGLNAAVSDATGVEPGRTLADTLEAGAAQLGGDVFVVLDGFEEYFLYHEDEEGAGTFLEEFPEAIRRRGLRASFLLALREDALARIDRFKASIPGLFANYLRLDHLDRAAARDAIVRPVDRYNELVDADAQVSIEPELVESVLDQVVAGKVALGHVGRGAVGETDGGAEGRIETPFLQLVMDRLWETEREAGSHTLRRSTLDELGGAEQIVRTHLGRALGSLTAEQRDIASAVFNHLVTPTGAKIAHADSDLARYAAVDEAELQPILATLTDERILRPVAFDGGAPRHEIYHDVLGEAVLAWRIGHETERELARERQAAARRHRRLLAALAGGGALVAVMAAVTAYAVSQRSEARTQAREAQTQARNAHARQLDGAAISLFGSDPELSLLLAAEAARLVPTPQAERTLRTAYIASRERATFTSTGPVSAASYSPDGKLVLVASEDGSARLFDAKSQRLVRTLRRAGAPLLDAGFSADGRRIVAGGENGEVQVWNASSGALLAMLQHGPSVRTAALDPSGKFVVTGGGRVAKIWQVGNGLVDSLPWGKPVTETDFSPDGKLVLVTGNDSKARIYQASTGRLVRTLDQGGRVTSATFGLGGRLLVTTGANETARIWRVADGQLLHSLEGHRASVLDAAFSPGGSRVATVAADGTGRIWDLRTGVPVASIGGHKGIVEAVAFSPDGNFVLTGSADRTAQTSKADDGTGRALFAGHTDSVHTVQYSPDGRRVLTASDDGTARLWDPEVQVPLELVRMARGPLKQAEYVGKDRIVVAGPGRQALVLRAEDGRVVDSIAVTAPVAAVASSPTGELLAVAAGRIVVLRRPDGETHRLRHADKVASVAFAQDGRRLVTGGRKGGATIWSVDGEKLVELSGHSAEITDVAFSADGSRVATASRDRSALIWDAGSGRQLRELAPHRDDVTSIAFSPDSSLVLTASRDHEARLWNAETGALAQVLHWHFGEVADASFSPDGRWIVTAGPVTVGLWQPGVKDPILPYGFGGHGPRVSSAVFDPSGRYVLTAGTDQTVRRARCIVCAGLDELLVLADAQLAASRRKLTADERKRYGLD
jgi:WD40 repeat protein